MGRSVVLQGAERCDGCRLPVRWCVCRGLEQVDVPLAVDVLQHRGESWKPTSTGHLLGRIVTGTRIHVWDPRTEFSAAAVVRPDHEMWVLHPKGEAWPTEVPANVQLVLLDGTWAQASEMLRQLGGMGRRVALPPPSTPSRFWLRTQHDGAHVSTFEALLLALSAMGRIADRDRLESLFELHVHAALLSRGKKVIAAEYLESSPVKTQLIERLAAAGHSA